MKPITTCQWGPSQPTSSLPSFIITPFLLQREMERWQEHRVAHCLLMDIKVHVMLPTLHYKAQNIVWNMCPVSQIDCLVDIMNKSFTLCITAGNLGSSFSAEDPSVCILHETVGCKVTRQQMWMSSTNIEHSLFYWWTFSLAPRNRLCFSAVTKPANQLFFWLTRLWQQ